MSIVQSKSSKIVTISVLALLIAILLVIFYVVPSISSLREQSNIASQKKSELELGRAKVKAIKDAINLINTSKDSIDKVSVALPSEPRTEEALVIISDAVANSGLALSNIAVAEIGSSDVKISFSTVGDFVKTQSLIAKLESSLRPVFFDDFEITALDETSDLNSTINVSFPYLSSKEDAEGSADKSKPADQEVTIEK